MVEEMELSDEAMAEAQDALNEGRDLFRQVNEVFSGRSHRAVFACLAMAIAARWSSIDIPPQEDILNIARLAAAILDGAQEQPEQTH